jgi:hypothetical protein
MNTGDVWKVMSVCRQFAGMHDQGVSAGRGEVCAPMTNRLGWKSRWRAFISDETCRMLRLDYFIAENAQFVLTSSLFRAQMPVPCWIS